MKTMLKRTTSFLLTLAMLFAMLPAFGTLTAYAASLTGSFDSVSCPEPGKIRVSGWAADAQNHAASVTIHVYVCGGAGVSGAEGHDLGKAEGVRTDVNTVVGIAGNHGFDFIFDTQKYGEQTVYVYAVLGSTNIQLGNSKSVHISPPEPAYGDPHWNLSRNDDCPEKPDGVYRIASAANPNFSLDILGGSLDSAANVQLYSNGESDAQLFHLRRVSYKDVKTGKGLMEQRTVVFLMNVKSQRFLDKSGSTTNVHQYGTTPDNANKQWIMHNNGDGTYSFESVATPGNFITIVDGSIGNGKNIAVAPPNSDGKPTLYQKFYLNAEYVHGDNRLGNLDGFLKTGEYRLWTSTANGRCDSRVLDIPSKSKDQGTQAQIWTVGDGYSLHQFF